MKKILTAVVLILTIILFGACTTSQNKDDSQLQIDALKQQTATLEQLISSQQELINSLIEQMKEFQNKLGDNDKNMTVMQEKIDELQSQNNLYKAQLRNLIGQPIEYIAKEPVYNQTENEKILIMFESTPDQPTPFLDFLKYYKENRPLGENKTYILRPDDCEDEGMGIMAGAFERRYFIIDQDGEQMVYEKMCVRSEVLGPGYIREGYSPNASGSLMMYLFWKPLDAQTLDSMQTDFKNLWLEFGKTDETNEYFGNYEYVNIFLDGICIGTSYYNAFCYISYTGFKDFIIEHLEIL